MTETLISVFLVMILLTVFVVIALRVVAENATRRVDTYFLNKLEEYNEEFDEKVEKIEKLESEKEFLENVIEALEEDKAVLETPRFYKPRPVMRDVYIPVAHYIDAGFFADYKAAKQMLRLDYEGIIRGVMERNPYTGDINRYNTAREIQSLLNYQAVFDMATMPGNDQMQVFLQVLSGEHMMLFLDYVKTLSSDEEEFDIITFQKWLEEVCRAESPLLEAYFSEEMDFHYISEFVRCRVDKNVCDGVRIIYQGHLYDYSIYESTVYEDREFEAG